MQLQPMPLGRVPAPFSHPDWIFEIKWDGFRSLAVIEQGDCRLLSRNRNQFKSFPALEEAVPRELRARRAVLDGEIVCLDSGGKPQFADLLSRRGEPRFYAFDLLSIDGEDTRYLPLIERKSRLRSLVTAGSDRLLYCDHVEGDGVGLFRMACLHDLEGVVAKQKFAPYLITENRTWLKIRNREYSQWAGREELFERERATNPDAVGWGMCVEACEQLATGELRA